MIMVEAMQKILAGYKQTELGVIPGNWKLDSLGNICDYQNGSSLEKYFNQYNGHSVISIGNYSTDGKYIENGTFIDLKVNPEVKKFVLDKDDLTMILNDKTSVGDIIGRVLLIERDDTYVFNQRTMRLKPQTEVLPKYLYFILNSEMFHNRMRLLAKPGTQIYINTDDVVTFKIFFPISKDEQSAIVSVISDINDLILSLEKLIAKKRAIKQGAMQELLTGKRRLPGFSEKWEMARLGDLLDYERPDKYTVKDTEYIEKGQIPVLTANKSFILGFTNEDFGVYDKTPVIIFDDFTTDSKYVEFPFKIKSSAIKILKSKSGGTNLKYIFERMKIIRFPMGDHKRYYISEYQNIEIPVPKPNEQDAIAKAINDFDVEIEALEQKLAKYKMLKQGMMQVLLTGKVRLV